MYYLMADRELHNYLCKKILGKDFDEINAFLDAPVRVKGPRHRILFHDEDTIAKMSVFDIELGMATMLHKILDENKELEDVLKVLRIVEGFKGSVH